MAISTNPAWGTTWEDLTELNHKDTSLWVYLADVFLTWCERGVDGFRCDAGYMIPEPAWKYIAAKVREKYPQTIFSLEGLGGPWETTENMLNHCNLNWAYSELFKITIKIKLVIILNTHQTSPVNLVPWFITPKHMIT